MPDLGPLLYSPESLAGLASAVIADVRWYLDGRPGLAAYEAGHIPGAIFVSIDTDLSAKDQPASSGRHPLPDPHDFAATLARLGIGPHDAVVAYDDTGGGTAGRLVWMLRAIGRRAGLLDGGLAAWPGQLTSGTDSRPGVPAEPNRPWPAKLLATYADVNEVPHRTETVLIDARSRERYLGRGEVVDPRAGHIPAARSLQWTQMLDPDTGRFRSPEALRAVFAEEGIDATTDLIASCGSGVSACADLIGYQVAFDRAARLFVPSFSGWSSSPMRPIETVSSQGT